MRYVLPMLSAVQVTGVDGGPVEVAAFDVAALMKDPKMVEAATTLALGAVENERAKQDPANWDEPQEVTGEVLTDQD
jgi:hypothetical protein